MKGKEEATEGVRFFNVSLVNANVMSTPKFPQPQRLIGELIHSIEAASPRFAWIQFLFRRDNYSPALVSLKNAMHRAAEQIKTSKRSWIDDTEYDRAELHRDWYKRSDSILAFFPFAGLDIIEQNGIYFGTNTMTKGPIVYDPFKRGNPHFLVIGKTGWGKSILLKSWVSRMAKTYPDLAFMVFDSIRRSEYGSGADGTVEHSFAGLTGSKVIRFNPSQPMGLDPVRLFNRKQASSLLARMAHIGIDERDLRAELSKIVQSDGVRTVQDIYGASMSEKLMTRLEGNLKPLGFLFEGEPQQPWLRTIFVLDDLPDDEEVRSSAVVLASALAMAALKSLPITQRKVLLIDEAWPFFKTDDRGRLLFSEATDMVSEMARTGRHYNIALVLATQYSKDLMTGQGRTVHESCATKVILHQDPSGENGGSELAAQLFGLSEQERAFVECADPGFGIMVTERGRVPFYNQLTPMEHSYFTTRPE